MLGSKPSVPLISVTPEAEEDDDHNYLSLAEALTDTELLDADESSGNYCVGRKKKSRSKLKIKLSDNEDGLTDIENFEGSSDEDDPEELQKSPSLPDFKFGDSGVYKETFKIKSRRSGGKRKLHTQFSTCAELTRPASSEEDHDAPEALTDLEDCVKSDEDDEVEENETPEIFINDELLDPDLNTTIAEKLEDDTNSFVEFGNSEDDRIKPKRSKGRLTKSKKLLGCVDYVDDTTDLTDQENLGSSSSENEDSTKFLPKRANQTKSRRKKRTKPAVNSTKPVINLDVDHQEAAVFTEAEMVEEDEKDSESSNDSLDYDTWLEEFSGKLPENSYTLNFAPTASTSNLNVPAVEQKNNITDVEYIDSSSDEKVYTGIRLAVVSKKDEVQDQFGLTDEEVMSDQDDREEVQDVIPEIKLPPAYRKLVTLSDREACKPLITVTYLRDNEDEEDEEIRVELTDEEDFSDTEAILFAQALTRGNTPEISIFDYSFEDAKETYFNRKSSTAISESLTDTEELNLTPRRARPKSKGTSRKSSGLFLSISPSRVCQFTDTEDVVLSDDAGTNVLNVFNSNEEDGGTTDVENLMMSDDEKQQQSKVHKLDVNEHENLRASCVTPIFMREMGGETVLSKDGNGPFSDKVRLEANKRVVVRQFNVGTSPVPTDIEDVEASGDEQQLNEQPSDNCELLQDSSSSTVFAKYTKKPKVDESDQVMYLRGGCYREVHTDTEDVSGISDADDVSMCRFGKKVSVDILGDNKILLSDSSARKEWSTSGRPAEDTTVASRTYTPVTPPTTTSPITDQQQQQQGGEIVGETWSKEQQQQHQQPQQQQPPVASPRHQLPFRDGSDDQRQDASSHRSGAAVTDQHQLSEDMKRLLEDMERESKK